MPVSLHTPLGGSLVTFWPTRKSLAAGAKVDALDCLKLAEEAGSSKAVNIVLMGRLSHYFDLPEEAWQKSLEAMVPRKFLELNTKAIELGKNA